MSPHQCAFFTMLPIFVVSLMGSTLVIDSARVGIDLSDEPAWTVTSSASQVPSEATSKEAALKDIEQNAATLQDVDPKLRDDDEVVRKAISMDATALQYASPRLRGKK